MIRKSVDRLEPYVPGEQPAALDVVKLNTNENPYPPSPKAVAAAHGFDAEFLRRYPQPESGRLRARIAALHGVAPEMVIVGNGSDEVLALCTRAFVENDGTIGYFDPSYSLYGVLAAIRDVKSLPVSLDDGFGWQMPDGYAASLFFLTNPNAPTGMLHDPARISAFCREAPGVVVVDEAYGDFASRNCMSLASELDNVLVCRTLSKSYSLAGLRVGYAVGHPDLIEALDKVRDSYNLDAISQAVALAAIEDQAYMRTNVSRIIATRGRLAAALTELSFGVFPSETNFLWVRPPVDAEGLYLALKERNVFVRYFTGIRTAGFLRITVGTDAEVDRLLMALREILG